MDSCGLGGCVVYTDIPGGFCEVPRTIRHRVGRRLGEQCHDCWNDDRPTRQGAIDSVRSDTVRMSCGGMLAMMNAIVFGGSVCPADCVFEGFGQ